ncbi:hypothetical protein GH714_016695 [Hevea brasiliensis]|uniref:Disease resistance protein RPS4B/Roq1-like leucine-rich repeats domain-containing protein n=1 Tax=Hevea brasiliensis TaxID=3981 RepID=A0A6A6L9E3_HEVBR|nr:hypothetical protein GH714_016695 [Hevea brasiliensis]
MRYCTSLETFPSVINLRSLKTLNFSDCSNLMKCPEIAKNIVYVNLKGTAIEELPKSTGHLSDLITLDLKDYKRISNLLESICLLKSLVTINLSGCSDITRIPNVSGKVRFLYLSETTIEEIPSSIGSLSRLSCLDLTNCKRLKNLPCDVSKLASFEKLILSGCTRITRIPVDRFEVLRKLYLNDCSILNEPNAIGFLFSLEALDLSGNLFSEIPQNILQLENLEYLGLRDCLQLRLIPAVPPRLTKLDAENCISLRSVTSKSTGVEGNIF